jgi:PAS domain S-box-containing protein
MNHTPSQSDFPHSPKDKGGAGFFALTRKNLAYVRHWLYRKSILYVSILFIVGGIFIFFASMSGAAWLKIGKIHSSLELQLLSLLVFFAGVVMEVFHQKYFTAPLRNRPTSLETPHALPKDGLQHFLQMTNLAVVEWDALFRIVRWNPAAERIFGYKASDVMGKYAAVLFPQNEQELRRILADLAIQQTASSLTSKNRTQDGRAIFCRWNSTPLIDAQGKFLGAISLCEEITEFQKSGMEVERLAAVVRNCSELVGMATPEGKIVFLNDSGCRLLGIDAYNVTRYHIADTVAEHLRETIDLEILPTLGRGETWKGELRYRNQKTGAIFDAQSTIFGIRDPESQEMTLLANISLDVTERKKAEAAIREKDRKLQLFADNVSDFIWSINFSGKATYIAPSVKQMLGYAPEEFGKFTFKDYLSPESAQFGLTRLENAIANIQPGKILASETFELEYRRKDGTYIWTEVHCNGMYDEDGKIIGMQGITRDISRRKEVEQQLKASERRHRLFAENVNAILWELDFTGHYTYVSPSIKEVLGYTPEEALSFRIGEIMTPASAELAGKYFAEVLEARQSGRPIEKGFFEGEYFQKDGTKIWGRVNYSAMYDEAGEPIGMQGILINIDDKKRTEAELTFKNVLLQAQQEVSIDGIVAADADHKVILRNRRFNEMWRLPAEVSVSEDDMVVLHTGSEIVAEPEEFLARVLYLYDHREEKSRDEVRMKDGRVFDRYTAPMFGEDGRYYGRVWFFRDVTENIRMVEALRKSEDRYRRLYEKTTENNVANADSGAET